MAINCFTMFNIGHKMQYKNNITAKVRRSNYVTLFFPMVIFCPAFIEVKKISTCSAKKDLPLLSLPIFIDGVSLSVFRIETDIFLMFIKISSCPASFFNAITIRNYLMLNEKIVELIVGEETEFSEGLTCIKFLSPKGKKEVRLGIQAPYNVRIYTEETRKKYLSDCDQLEEEGQQSC